MNDPRRSVEWDSLNLFRSIRRYADPLGKGFFYNDKSDQGGDTRDEENMKLQSQ